MRMQKNKSSRSLPANSKLFQLLLKSLPRQWNDFYCTYTLHCNKKYFYAAILWAVVILAVAITPGSEISKVNQSFFTAKLAHFGEFFIFGWLLSKSFSDVKKPILIALFWAAFTESLQLFVPGRSFEYSDIALNSFGSIAGLYKSIYRYQTE